MRREKSCGVVVGEVLVDLLVFLRGVWGNWCFGCGFLVVSLWWIDGANVVIRRVFFWGENYANFFGFILGLLHPFAREQQRVKYLGLTYGLFLSGGVRFAPCANAHISKSRYGAPGTRLSLTLLPGCWKERVDSRWLSSPQLRWGRRDAGWLPGRVA
jgi:hypothetical protein